jgi:hypothetical protein
MEIVPMETENIKTITMATDFKETLIVKTVSLETVHSEIYLWKP